MKTTNDLLKLALILMQKSNKDFYTVFVDFSGHVNQLSVRYYPTGSKYADENNLPPRKCEAYLDKENEVQMLYYWILSNFPANWFNEK